MVFLLLEETGFFGQQNDTAAKAPVWA